MMPCKHWRDCGLVGGGCCNADAYEKPSFGVCLKVCTKYDGPSRKGIAEAYGPDFTIPSHYQPRHAQILVGSQPSPPLYAGTALKRVLSSVGVKPCGGCDRRAANMDDWDKNTVRPAIAKVGRATKRLLSGRSP